MPLSGSVCTQCFFDQVGLREYAGVVREDGEPETTVEVARAVKDDRHQPGVFVALRVAPHAPLSALREVYIVVPPTLPSADRREGRR